MKLAIDPLSARRLQLQFGSIRVYGEVDLIGSDLDIVDGHTKMRATRCSLRELLFTSGSWEIRADAADVANVCVDSHRGGQMAVRTGVIDVGPVRVVGTSARVTCEQLSLPGGFEITSSREIVIRELVGRGVSVVVDPLIPAPTEPAAESTATDSAPQPGLADYAFLDALNGHVNVDLDVDVTVPVIGRRRATHAFRVPITDGTIDFRKLEKNLSTLEDAVLDFEVKDGQLILEKDLPLIPFDNTTLVSWDLDDDGQMLANQNRVRLRTLMGYRVKVGGRGGGGDGASDGDSQKSFALHSLAARNVDLQLSIDQPAVLDLGGCGRVHLGISERPGLVGLTMTGEACHRAEADPDQPPDPISATLGLTELNASLEQLPLGPYRLSVGAVHLGAIKTAMLSLSGFVPARIELKLSELTLHDLRLSPACMSSNEIGQGAV